jgi:hypothetical protein
MAVVLAACGSAGSGSPGRDAGSARDVATPLDVAVERDSVTPRDARTDREATTDEVTVTVDRGYGGGTYPPKTAIHVWSDVDPQRALTTGWTGAMGVPTEWNGDYVVPDRDVTLAATIVKAPVALVTRTYTLAAGSRTILGHFPSRPKGLVLFFHGAQFDVDELRDNAASTITIALVRAGYAVVAPPSEQETADGIGGWNPALTDNTDLDNIISLVAALRADGSVSKSAPVVSWGMSSGGIFSHTVGAKLPADVVTAYCGPGIAGAIAITHARTAWYLAKDDQTLPTSVPDSEAFQKQLAARGITTDLYVHPPTPLYGERFLRVTGIDARRSAAIAASLHAHHDVDASGNWLVTGSSVTDDLDLDGLAGLTEAQTSAVAEEIKIMAADHELYDDVANRMLAFIEGS